MLLSDPIIKSKNEIYYEVNYHPLILRFDSDLKLQHIFYTINPYQYEVKSISLSNLNIIPTIDNGHDIIKVKLVGSEIDKCLPNLYYDIYYSELSGNSRFNSRKKSILKYDSVSQQSVNFYPAADASQINFNFY